MPQASTYPLKSPIDSGDKILGTESDGTTRNFSPDAIKEYSKTPFIEVTAEGDDKGLVVTEQFSVGTKELGKESVFGEGDSYPVPVAYHCTETDTTGTTITNAIDRTAIFKSDTGSTAGLFNGVSAGNYILIGTDYKHGGIKAKIAVAGDMNSDDIIGEFITTGDIWYQSKYMSVGADRPYEQRGRVIASVVGSEQWRFGFNRAYTADTWQKITLNINGVDQERYWSRFRVINDIVTDPMIEQIKMHTARFEINADGVTEYFAGARYQKSIYTEIKANALKNPPNENILISPGVTVLKTDNEFANGAQDGNVLMGVLPVGIDTSIPIQLIVDWYGKSTGAGDVELELSATVCDSDFIYDGTALPAVTQTNITTLNNQRFHRQTSIFEIYVQDALPGDTIYGSLFRDATSGNPDDTYASNIVITNARIIAYFWR